MDKFFEISLSFHEMMVKLKMFRNFLLYIPFSN